MSDSLAMGFHLSPQQKHLWNQAADGTVLNSVLSVRFEGSLDVERVHRALEGVVARHEILRTIFQRQPGMKTPVQTVKESLAPSWEQLNLTHLNAEQQQEQSDRIFANQAQLAFDLTKGPVVRAVLLALADHKHVLVLSLPALCADTVSLSNLVREVNEAYFSRSSINEVFQYADYAGFGNELLEDETNADAVAAKHHWQEVLSHVLPDLHLPFENKLTKVSTFQPAVLELELPPHLASQPEEFLAACWHTLLWRLSGQPTVTVGRVADGRNHDELIGAMGLFARSLLIEYELESGRSFSDVKTDLQKIWSSACDRQDFFPLGTTTQDLPLSFASEEWGGELCTDKLTFSTLRLQSLTQRFRIQLCSIVNGASRSLQFRYDPQHFSRSAAERIANQFLALAKSAFADPSRPINDLEIISDAERRQVVVEFNSTAAEYPHDQCIQELFEHAAERLPAQPALRFGETLLTYAQLNSRANQLALVLRRNGVKPNMPVPLCLDRSAEMIVAVLGILKAGGAYVPLLPENPKARLAQQLSDTNSPVLISQQKWLDNLPPFSGHIICLDRDTALLDKEPSANPDRVNSPTDTAYIIYTSGSTGVPKGVEVRHSNLVNYAWFIARKLNAVAEPMNFATVSTLAADLGNTAIFPALISGGCLHVMPYETAMAANRFSEYLTRYPVDVLKITPSHLGSLLAAPDSENILPRRFLILGGEAASWDLVARVQQRGTCSVINHYGPTEATVGCCTFSISENDVSAQAPATVPIGRPIANAQVYILDQHMHPVPVGVAGELCVGGVGIAKGYLHQPQQTAERFLPSPFSTAQEARLYRTGDLARFLPDGNIEFLGRIDQQVKIRGFRVEPAEIESVLKKRASVRQALVIAFANKTGDKRLVAYVVSDKKSSQFTADLRSYLQERLPEYMVPSAIVGLDALPLTRNGKVDTAALPSPDELVVEHAVIAPRNAVEQGLVDIWRQVLRVDQVGVEDNFFDLGGHSLLATQVIARIRSTFHVQLPLRSLFDAPTVAGLAGQIATLPQTSQDEEVARLLQELEGLSDDEAERLLGEEMRKAAEGSGNN
ncbi:MAG TPA: amino acid adenylation domain-containing protein [Terriglobales bacterium]